MMQLNEAQNIYTINHLKMHFPIRKGVLGRVKGCVKAVDDVSLEVRRAKPWAWWVKAAAGRPPWGAASCGPTSRQR